MARGQFHIETILILYLWSASINAILSLFTLIVASIFYSNSWVTNEDFLYLFDFHPLIYEKYIDITFWAGSG